MASAFNAQMLEEKIARVLFNHAHSVKTVFVDWLVTGLIVLNLNANATDL